MRALPLHETVKVWWFPPGDKPGVPDSGPGAEIKKSRFGMVSIRMFPLRDLKYAGAAHKPGSVSRNGHPLPGRWPFI